MKWLYILSVSVYIASNACWAQPLVAPNAQISVVSAFTPAEVVAVLKPLGGTLFFDVSERDRMDRARKSGPISIDPVTTIREPPVINGFVKRSDGITAVWLDGEPRYDVPLVSSDQIKAQHVGNETSIFRVRDEKSHGSVLKPIARKGDVRSKLQKKKAKAKAK